MVWGLACPCSGGNSKWQLVGGEVWGRDPFPSPCIGAGVNLAAQELRAPLRSSWGPGVGTPKDQGLGKELGG